MKCKFIILLLAVASISMSGCQLSKFSREDLGKLNPIKKLNGQKSPVEVEEFQDPVRMAVIWSDGVYDEAGSAAVRGFGARIYFYGAEGEAIKADGEMVVYGYDDDVKKDSFDADRKFVFEREKFQTHFSENGMGPSYSIWVPWDKVGGPMKTVSLVPIFLTGSGKQIKGGHSVNILNGVHPESKEQVGNISKVEYNRIQTKVIDDSKVVQASAYEEVDEEDSEVITRAKRKPTTIRLNPSMKQRLELNAANFSGKNARTSSEERIKKLQPRQTDQISSNREPYETGDNEIVEMPEPSIKFDRSRPESFERVYGLPGSRN